MSTEYRHCYEFVLSLNYTVIKYGDISLEKSKPGEDMSKKGLQVEWQWNMVLQCTE